MLDLCHQDLAISFVFRVFWPRSDIKFLVNLFRLKSFFCHSRKFLPLILFTRNIFRGLLSLRLKQGLELFVNFIDFVIKLLLLIVEPLHAHYHSLLVLLFCRELLPCTFYNWSTLNNHLLRWVVWLQLYIQLRLRDSDVLCMALLWHAPIHINIL